MSDAQSLRLFDGLYNKTAAGGIPWRQFDANWNQLGPDQFEFSSGVYVVRLSRHWNSEPEDWDFCVKILDGNDAVVEEFWDLGLLDMVSDDKKAAYYARFKELFEMARRKALGTDKAIDEIMKFLGD